MSLTYITADQIGTETGGGLVTKQELRALQELSQEQTHLRKDPSLSSVEVYSRSNLGSNREEPWKWDDQAYSVISLRRETLRLAHFYSGTFGKTVRCLKDKGCKVSFTVAAHDRAISQREHEKLGINFRGMFPHLCEERLWQGYILGYKLADAIVCPSTIAEKTVREYGPDFENKDIRVIPHGCDIPNEDEIKPLPNVFSVGYLGSYGADKGVGYLLSAWKKLNYSDGSLLILGGKESTTHGRYLLEKHGGGNVHLAGWQNNVGDFYNSISLLCQPSATEGFGCEVIEAASYGRPIICSETAGAADFIYKAFPTHVGAVVNSCDSDHLAFVIDEAKKMGRDVLTDVGKQAREKTKEYSWDIIRQRYKNLWLEMLS